MTKEERKRWIDNASYQELMEKWRNAPLGCPWFTGEIGDYFIETMDRKQKETPHDERVRVSKKIGW